MCNSTTGAKPFGALGLVLAISGFALGGCTKGEVTASSSSGGTKSLSAGSGTGGDTGLGPGGTSIIPLEPGNTQPVQPVDAAVASQKVACDGGEDCKCPPFNLAVLGKPGKWGANPDGDPDTALQQWLNSSSAGTARVDNFPNRVTLTPSFLATYNVIIVASLSDDSSMGPWWTFDQGEVAAFHDWLENGGGVISMTGYAGTPDEIKPVNQLLDYYGLTYGTDGIWGSCSDWQICGCNQSMTVADWNRTDPVIANLSRGVTLIGYTNGRAIIAPADAHVAATIDSGKSALVGKVVNNKGHVLLWGDEWLSYTSQWTGAGNPKATDPTCQGYLAQDKYQMAQFWYNMIRWSQPGATCFKLVDQQQPISIW